LPLASIALWSVVLIALSAIIAPVLLIAPLAISAWGYWLRVRLGGVTGDCLGAGVEIVETLLLAALVLAGNLQLLPLTA
jgi:adenosylcobinamide-GDP ribazoletransferase